MLAVIDRLDSQYEDELSSMRMYSEEIYFTDFTEEEKRGVKKFLESIDFFGVLDINVEFDKEEET